MKKLKYFILSMTIAFTLGKSTKVYGEVNEKRIFGKNRYSTAVEISKSSWTNSDNLVIATGDNFPDALCAVPLAKKLNAPILLANKNSLSNEVIDEIKRLKVKDAYIIGGESVISENVKYELKNLNINCKRLYGANRYSTSIAVAKEMGTVNEIVLATGENFPDALAISPIAASKGMPIILTPKVNPPEVIKNYASNNNISKSYIIGGTSAIDTSIENILNNPIRITGKNRYDTNIAIINKFNYINPSSIYVATGLNFPDALTGSVIAAKNSAPIVLLSNTVDNSSKNYISNNLSSIKDMFIFGGENVISSNAINIAKGMNNTNIDNNNNNLSPDHSIDDFKNNGQIEISLPKEHIEVGDKVQVNLKLINAPKNCKEKPFFRVFMDETATVDANGVITALSPGLAHLEVYYLGKTSEDFPLYVYPKNTACPSTIDEIPNIVKEKVINPDGNDLMIDLHKVINHEKFDLSQIQEKISSHLRDYFDFLDFTLYAHGDELGYTRSSYFLPKDEVISKKNETYKKANEIIKSIIKPGMSDYDKALAIHDYVAGYTEYSPIEEYPHTAYSALVKGSAVCDGFARAVKLLCRLAGVECYTIIAQDSGGGSHEWNIVKINGKYRHLDAAYDAVDPVTHEFTRFYFNLKDDDIGKHLQWDRSLYPKCD